MGDAGAGGAEAVDLGRGDVDAVGQPDVVAHPTPLIQEVDRAATQLVEAVLGLLDGLAQVGVQAQAVLAGQLGGLDHQLGGDRER